MQLEEEYNMVFSKLKEKCIIFVIAQIGKLNIYAY